MPSPFSDSPLRAVVADDAENRPGVYRFVGPRGEVLYVGKSIRVRTRLLSYFRGEKVGRAAELLRSARGVEWDYVPNEFEALLRELRLIRSFRPRFNVRHRRERRWAWVRLSAHPAPRLVATRSPRPDGSRYFGPFPARADLPDILRELAVETGLRDCPDRTPMHFADQMDLLAPPRTPGCMRAELGNCPAPCAARCTAGEYRANVERALAFLRGTSDELTARLRRRLDRLAHDREFEHAARLRDRIERLERLRAEVRDFERDLERLNFLYEVPSPVGPSRAYLVLRGRVRESFDAAPGARLPPGLAERVRRIASAPDPDPTALSPGEREELFLVIRWFRRNPDELARTRSLDAAAPPDGAVPSGEGTSSTGGPLAARELSPRGRAPGSCGTPPREPAAPRAASASRAPSPRDPDGT